ncbi:MAG: hypothetical protein OHM77_00280 [Candidatus Nitricoxidivorans perseverans]|uniref:FecR protein domain-containing protein n=1 Tax=Candidatus Nitricoxidivorans perseverans TaxID=2975601 RepID=A0AA49IVI3_9PROT|nr:MAG: hypothetical protein OHM77_00280 [Candidatus Nitricoxidivorans perseverans]
MTTRRDHLKRLAAAGLLGTGGAMGFMQRALAAGANPVPPGLHRLSGSVTMNGVPARAGQLVRPGDTIITGADGEAIYVIGSDAFLQRGGTTVSFGATAADFMRVLTGRILSVFGKGDRRITVSTATIGIRGTGCYIEAEAAKTYFCLCYGEVDIVPAAAPRERATYATTHHDHPLYIHNDPAMPTSMVPATVINHTDAELTMLENLVGRWPPFYGRSGGFY